ncbi:HK97 family phage prohead protease [Streptomyces sp. NPDC005918]|uniref:HK97 family phage prohead protease n=1 Tax=Streptomyces sp. NPDC005918 TaxID=3155454 RepID=UPI0033E12850
MPSIMVVVGPPCAGKSTYIAEHKTAGDVVVDFDALAAALGSTIPHDAPAGVRDVALAARKAAIAKVMAGVDADAWIIHTSPPPGAMSEYEAVGVELVLLDPGIDVCLSRADEDKRPDGTAAAIEQWYETPPPAAGEKRRKGVGMRTKDFAARVKAAGPDDGLAPGQFTALVSVFDNEDSMGDVVRAGAFTETLAAWAAKGDSIPVIWSHAWGDPFAHIGHVVKATETLAGLEVVGQIDDLEDNPTAAQVSRLLKGRRVTQFSFAYDVDEEAYVRDDDHRYGGYWELRKLSLHEVGPCLVGANQETELLAAKASGLVRGVKAGRVLSQDNYDKLTTAYEEIGQVLKSADPEKNRKTGQPGRPGAPAADGTTPSAAEDAPPAKEQPAPGDDLDARVAAAVAKALAAREATANNPSSTEDETTPDPREAASHDAAAKAGAASARLRTELQLQELELSLTD